MFARKVAVRLKPNSLVDFTRVMEHEILPWLRNQEGFLDLIVLAVTNSQEVATISFWDHKRSAEAYNTVAYPQVVKALEELLDGRPYVKTFDVVSSTLYPSALGILSETDLIHEAGAVPRRFPCDTSA
jgi:heme-degrading monooxygenase HmoA